jgi:hypothetical protein
MQIRAENPPPDRSPETPAQRAAPYTTCAFSRATPTTNLRSRSWEFGRLVRSAIEAQSFTGVCFCSDGRKHGHIIAILFK